MCSCHELLSVTQRSCRVSITKMKILFYSLIFVISLLPSVINGQILRFLLKKQLRESLGGGRGLRGVGLGSGSARGGLPFSLGSRGLGLGRHRSPDITELLLGASSPTGLLNRPGPGSRPSARHPFSSNSGYGSSSSPFASSSSSYASSVPYGSGSEYSYRSRSPCPYRGSSCE